ncbi:hypothetical protein [Psychrobacillus sp. FJAT-21963]|uniref:hypothetical protein n=1 Tax=Psychrobacillus sp. FJAT-21963 TaxID=1712028 RepID=UPI000700D328|nr:hypothetical protein [Psychrobacillus sp. FJAT-21963]KQL33348.1 hypothetical protein AN959_17455 [Psychrobacillus sp. FJAT-21963]
MIIVLSESEKKEFIGKIPEITAKVFEDENEGILFSKVLVIFLDKTVNRVILQRELYWSTEVEELKENFSKCLYIMATLATEESSST